MRLFSYVIPRDYGFAPNPFFNICTLATCKPKIRSRARNGDWIAGFGGKNTSIYERLVFCMQVTEKLSFDEYWDDKRFEKKKPDYLKSLMYYYGDNIYHHDNDTGKWLQEDSHHSSANGINYKNLIKDTSADAVLVSLKYWYFGSNACYLPPEFRQLIAHGRGYQIKEDTVIIEQLIEWLTSNYHQGINGRPFMWLKGVGFKRFKGDN